MTNNLTVSLCMIVKNEEKVLARCLESVKDHVDEMIIVDTGSTDKTKEIAASYGAKVYDFKWEDDFSKARNFAKEQATSEWVLQLDADEYFLEGEASKIKEEIAKTDKQALTIHIGNVTDESVVGMTHIYFRIYQNDPDIWYENRIHEQVKYKGESVDFDQTGIRILHTGYMKSVSKEKDKRTRNLDILKKELADNPNSGYMHLNMANEYIILEDYEKALSYSTFAFKNSHGKNFQSHAVVNIIKSLVLLKRYEEALSVIYDAKEAYKDFTDLTYMEGQIYEKMGRMFDAEHAYRRCIIQGETRGIHMTRKGIGTIFPGERLTLLALERGDYDMASEFANFLITLDRTNRTGILTNLKFIKRVMGEEGVMDYLEKLYNDESTESDQLKLHYLVEMRTKKGISHYYSKMKEDNVTLTNVMQFYSNLLIGNKEETHFYLNEIVQEKNQYANVFSIFYSCVFKDAACEEKLRKENKTTDMIFNALQKQEVERKKKNYDVKMYTLLMTELLACGFYEEVERLLSIADLFDPIVYKEIGKMFYDNLNQDLSIEYYTKYLQYVKGDGNIYLVVAQMLYQSEMYEDAILFAEKANELNENHFYSIELYIEANEKLGNKEEVSMVINQALELFPESHYLNKKLQTK